MRSALTVLGVVIGITSIVGMTAMIRGFDQSLRDMIRRDRAEHDLRPAVRRHQLRQRRRVQRAAEAAEPDDLRRARASRSRPRRIAARRHRARRRRARRRSSRVFYRDQKTKPIVVFGTTRDLRRGHAASRSSAGRFFNGTEVQYRKNVVVLGNTPYQLLFAPSGIDPHRQDRCASAASGSRSSACSTSGRPPAASTSARTTSSSSPTPTYQRDLRPERRSASAATATILPIQIACVPRDGVHAGGRDRRRRARHAHPPRPASSTSRTTSTS